MVEQNVQDSVIMGDIVSNKVASPECPSCGAQNIPIMVCRDEDCTTRFCEFCNHIPWAQIAEKSDKSLAIKSFMMVGEKTKHGPYCSSHGQEVIVEAKAIRQSYVDMNRKDYENRIKVIKDESRILLNEEKLANKNMNYWRGKLGETVEFYDEIEQVMNSAIYKEIHSQQFTRLNYDFRMAKQLLLFGWALLIFQLFLIFPVAIQYHSSPGLVLPFSAVVIISVMIGIGKSPEGQEDQIYLSLIIPLIVLLNSVHWFILIGGESGVSVWTFISFAHLLLTLMWLVLLLSSNLVGPNKSVFGQIVGMYEEIKHSRYGTTSDYQNAINSLLKQERQLLDQFNNSVLKELGYEVSGNLLEFTNNLKEKFRFDAAKWRDKSTSLKTKRQGMLKKVQNYDIEIKSFESAMIGA